MHKRRSLPVFLPRRARHAILPLRADVAQLVEQRFRKPQVTGSNPVVGSPDCGLRIDWTLKACSRKLSELDVERWALGV